MLMYVRVHERIYMASCMYVIGRTVPLCVFIAYVWSQRGMYVYVCISIRKQTCMNACAFKYAYYNIHAYSCMHIHAWISMNVYPCMDNYAWISIPGYPRMDIHAWIFMQRFPYMYARVWIVLHGYPCRDMMHAYLIDYTIHALHQLCNSFIKGFIGHWGCWTLFCSPNSMSLELQT